MFFENFKKGKKMQDQSLERSQSGVESILVVPELLPRKRTLVLEAGTTPFDSDLTQEFFYIILSGKVKISQINLSNAREQTIKLLSRGDMFDVLTLLDNQEHDYIATVLEAGEALEVPMEDVRTLMHNSDSFNSFMLSYIANEMRSLEELTLDLSLHDVYERLVHLLARNTVNEGGKSHLELIDNLSHEELATLVGSVRKVVNRNLQRLKDEGLIEISRKKIELKNPQTLLEKLDSAT
jgi:CRP-like cAMP-binding protein